MLVSLYLGPIRSNSIPILTPFILGYGLRSSQISGLRIDVFPEFCGFLWFIRAAIYAVYQARLSKVNPGDWKGRRAATS